MLAFGQDARQFQFFAEDFRQFVEADLDLQNMLPILLPAGTDPARA